MSFLTHIGFSLLDYKRVLISYLPLVKMDISIKCPFVMQVCGPTGSGKSEWVANLIHEHEELLEEKIDKIYWHTPRGSKLPSSLAAVKNLVVKRRLPWAASEDSDNDDDEEEEDEKLSHRLIVLDDFAAETKNSAQMTELFTKGSHHRNISVIQMTQNLFWKSSDARTRALNVSYIVLMRQTRDLQTIKLLGLQAGRSISDKDAFVNAYNDATEKNYGYLLLSFHSRDKRALMLRTNIFSDERPPNIIYDLPSEKKAYKDMLTQAECDGVSEKVYKQ